MPDDPEKLVAEALRAQATSSGAHKLLPVGPTTTGSATEGSTTGRSTTDLTSGTRDAHPTSTTGTSSTTGAAWLLLLAILLGLASGTVVAVMTLR